VVEATRAEVMRRSSVRVERLMVEEPITTTSEEVSRDVVTELVTTEPALFVDVISTTVEDGASDVVSAEEGVSAAELEGVGSADDAAGEDSAAAVLAAGSLEDDMAVEAAAVVVDVASAASAVAVTPVPRICLLFGLMPSGMLSAPICAKPKKNESMVALIIFPTTPSSADWAGETPGRAAVELKVEIAWELSWGRNTRLMMV
jgi:hypothetical protein